MTKSMAVGHGAICTIGHVCHVLTRFVDVDKKPLSVIPRTPL
jgi:hypothetical protein